jgi:hypothetical protein
VPGSGRLSPVRSTGGVHSGEDGEAGEDGEGGDCGGASGRTPDETGPWV